MNTKLVDAILQLIDALPPEDKATVIKKVEKPEDWQTTLDQIMEHRKAIHDRRKSKAFDPSIDDVFAEMREDRSQELLEACSPQPE
ncbi:hypothetical protein PMG71_07175 [Roseofilum sp. BLCC_M154]|uniref:Addiction module component n=1 Tax=Roseofilum acuticapitatum BLCC-M154 TaxID=3022444 RepID=A0ABT7AQM2_9CYAN|nr:hypothetical protein [Roseofilum acuticapitatum]MDJ1169202.1 hypothetical protein [Roseofilum acuticapitatum BLCC-M154]